MTEITSDILAPAGATPVGGLKKKAGTHAEVRLAYMYIVCRWYIRVYDVYVLKYHMRLIFP